MVESNNGRSDRVVNLLKLLKNLKKKQNYKKSRCYNYIFIYIYLVEFFDSFEVSNRSSKRKIVFNDK
jgi:hypothetical protein